MKRILFIIISTIFSIGYGSAQIGYQVALINNATGEPRALETVAVDVEITNSAGTVIATSRQSATTNELGLLSLTVGDSDTFTNVDWTKLPFFISATVDGTLIGKTQILSVPVAEYAKHTGELTVEKLCSKTWTVTDPYRKREVSFNEDGTGYLASYSDGVLRAENKNKWEKNGNYVLVIPTGDEYNEGYVFIYFPISDCLCLIGGGSYIYR